MSDTPPKSNASKPQTQTNRKGGSKKKEADASMRITPRDEDYARWYTDCIQKGELADYSPVRGCMVIRPHGFAIWERIRDILDRHIKDTGHVNAYFPMFIPKSFLAKEAKHVEGFAMECAVVTHSGLEKTPEGDLAVCGKLEEELVVRPTSETIINHMFAKWVESYRDLPLLINQWANVVRWEMRTRLFLRTAEFLWQEGHTAHATPAEADEEARKMLEVYRRFAHETLALSVITGEKTEAERFAGADHTYTIEGMMQDRRALQAGTSHDLGQNFSRAFDIRFQNAEGELEYAWQTSWGVSTRLVGAVIMAHSDDKGLVLPPRIAPIHVVLIPIYRKDAEKERVLEAVTTIAQQLRDKNLSVEVDDRDHLKPGAKYYEWEKKGVPLRLEVGPRDLDKDQVFSARRDTGEKAAIPLEGLEASVTSLLDQIQADLLEKNRAFRETHTYPAETYADLRSVVEGEGGFVLARWCGNPDCETRIKEETKATIRCLPEDLPADPGPCVLCQSESVQRVIFSRAY